MQVQAERPISDQESVEVAVRRFLAAQQVPGTAYEGVVHRQAYTVAQSIASYNPSDAWNNLVREVLDHLAPSEGFPTLLREPSSSTQFGPANYPAVMLQEAELTQGAVRLKGWTDGFAALRIDVVDKEGQNVFAGNIHLMPPSPEGVRWFEQVVAPPVGAVAIILRTTGSSNGDLRPACRLSLPKRWREALNIVPPS
jgi:hypothetical protein